MHLDARAAQGSQKINASKLLAERQTQRLQTLIKRRNRVVADARYPSFAQVDSGQRLQHIVELAGGEVDGEILAAANAGGMLEISHAVFVEHDAPDRQANAGIGFGVGGRRRAIRLQ